MGTRRRSAPARSLAPNRFAGVIGTTFVLEESAGSRAIERMLTVVRPHASDEAIL
jgi:hypothetical protein